MNQLQTYRSRLSGPLLDRIDIHISVERTGPELLLASEPEECSHSIQRRVIDCQALQLMRQGCVNQRLSVKDLEQYGYQSKVVKQFLQAAGEKLRLSHRAIHRTVRVARTIADLTCSEAVTVPHIAEAMTYRSNVNDG